MKKTIIFGATSAIAQETAKILAQNGHALFLAGRNKEKLKIIADDLSVRGAHKIITSTVDINNTSEHSAIIQNAIDEMNGLDIALIAHGTLSNQEACEISYTETYTEFKTNCLSAISLLTLIANHFEQQASGTIIAISSVAGDRGRQSNYVYGSAKAAISIFLQGLRNRLHKKNVHVITIKPGFVDTPMTKDFEKGILWADPSVIAQGIIKAIEKKMDVVYLPWFWRYIMAVIKLIPERLFKRLSL